MIVPRYSYRIDSDGQIVERVGGEATSGVGKINLDGVQRPIRGVGTLRTPERDLLRVAAGILCADRLSPRRPRGKRRLMSDLASIHVPGDGQTDTLSTRETPKGAPS